MESSGVRQLLGPRSIWNTGEAEGIGPIVNEVDGIRMIPPADDEVPLGHVNLAVASERESPAINWLRSFIDRRLERDKIRFICVAILALNLALAAISFATFDGTRTVFGPPPCTDFAGFYAAGRILRAYSPSRVYDLELQDRVYHEVLPELPLHTKLPFVYPPFFSLIFEPFAALPYTQACLLWMVLSALLYLVGLAALWGTRQAIPAGEWPMVFLLAFSFQPFLECWLSGQTSVFGFAAMAWAVRCEALGRSFRAGLLICFCLYKPPLLVLIVPLLLVARRWRILLGFVAGAAGVAGISLLTFGWHGCLAYAQLASEFSRLINSSTVGIPRWKYIDLNNFFGLLCGGQTPASVALWGAGVLAVIPWLARGWWDYGRSDPDQKALLWATVLTWTLVLNVYVGAYDAILAAIAAVTTADVLVRRTGQIARALGAGFREMLALLYLVPWISQHVARSTQFQPFTLVLIAFGVYQLRLTRSTAPAPEAEVPRRVLESACYVPCDR